MCGNPFAERLLSISSRRIGRCYFCLRSQAHFKDVPDYWGNMVCLFLADACFVLFVFSCGCLCASLFIVFGLVQQHQYFALSLARKVYMVSVLQRLKMKTYTFVQAEDGRKILAAGSRIRRHPQKNNTYRISWTARSRRVHAVIKLPAREKVWVCPGPLFVSIFASVEGRPRRSAARFSSSCAVSAAADFRHHGPFLELAGAFAAMALRNTGYS